MASEALGAIAFDRPGGEACKSAAQRPIDLAHLSRQTMGDRALEQEILQMFAQQAVGVVDQIAKAGASETLLLAHGLKGSARGVGAFAIADCVGELERHPEDAATRKRLSKLVAQARDFIAAISR